MKQLYNIKQLADESKVPQEMIEDYLKTLPTDLLQANFTLDTFYTPLILQKIKEHFSIYGPKTRYLVARANRSIEEGFRY